MPRKSTVLPLATMAIAAATLTVALAPTNASAIVAPGTPAKDVHIGADNDNAANPFVQPAGVGAKLHMDNTDVIFGRGNDDLLIGRQGSDTLLAGPGSDILVGGPEGGSTSANSDVLIGDKGDDVNIWAPGDGSDAFTGDEGYDSAIFAPFVKVQNFTPELVTWQGRQIPKVKIDALPQFSCTIINVPPSENLGVEHMVRFNVNGSPVISVRLRKVEQVLCTSPDPGKVLVADLTKPHPVFENVPLSHVGGLNGAIIAAS
jgi:hypothetical protein